MLASRSTTTTIGRVRAGFCAIVGLPNVGKSTLLNRVLGRQLVAVSAKPQTTRDRIVGVHTIDLPGETPARAQIAYVDTPGVQDGRGPLRRYMRDAALAAAADADVVLLLVDATDRRGRMPERLAEPDAAALADAARAHPIVVGAQQGRPRRQARAAAADRGVDAGRAPASRSCRSRRATGDGVDALERAIARQLPVGPPLFPDDMVTDRSPQFIAQEIIREQLYHQLGKELPYASRGRRSRPGPSAKASVVIGAVIVVERDSQKPIVVGTGGARDQGARHRRARRARRGARQAGPPEAVREGASRSGAASERELREARLQRR